MSSRPVPLTLRSSPSQIRPAGTSSSHRDRDRANPEPLAAQRIAHQISHAAIGRDYGFGAMRTPLRRSLFGRERVDSGVAAPLYSRTPEGEPVIDGLRLPSVFKPML